MLLLAFHRYIFIGMLVATQLIVGFQHRSYLLQQSRDYFQINNINCDSDYTQDPERKNCVIKKTSMVDSIRKISIAAITAYSLRSGVNVRSVFAATPAVEAVTPYIIKGFQTKSGLKYFDMIEGKAVLPSPRATPSSPLEAFDSTFSSDRKQKQSFLHKHGNGRIVRGIDESLHTMKVGGKRRIIVPNSIGYTDFRVGPVATEPSDRRKLDKYVERLNDGKGELVFDLELVMVADDENDQGYYEDEPVTQEEIRQLVLNSMNAKDNAVRMDKMMQTTPKEKLFKKIKDVIDG